MLQLKRFEKFTQGIASCYKYIIKLKSHEMSSFGLKASHVMCIFFLGQNPDTGLKSGELVELCREDKAAISKSLAGLKKLGYVYTKDGAIIKYRKKYFISDSGMEIYYRICDIVKDAVDKCSVGLSEDELVVFYSSLDKITSNLGDLCSNLESADIEETH